jgi:hypothetical protein
MDRMGRMGGGGLPYDLPPDFNGQVYGPGSPVWNYIVQNYTPDEWAQIPPDTKRVMVNNAVDMTSANAQPGTLATQRLYDEAYNPGLHSRAHVPDRSPLADFLGGVQDFTQSPARDLFGLFGAALPGGDPLTRDETNHRGRARDERNAAYQAQLNAPPVQRHPMPDFGDLIKGFLGRGNR